MRGDAGWAEFSPFLEYDDDEAHRWWQAALEAAHLGYPDPVRHHVPVNVTIPAVDRERAYTLVKSSGGCTTAKVKVAQSGQTVSDEVERLQGVREALGPGGKIRIDANAAWDLETAIERIKVLDRAAGGLEYAEQPVATVADLARLRRAVAVPIAADESIRRSEDPHAVKRAQAADLIVLKVQPLGGVRACLRIAEDIGLPVVVSSALESSVGIQAGIALAAALPQLPYACGLATVHLLTKDVSPQPLLPVHGALPVRELAVDPTLIPADESTTAWWQERVMRMQQLDKEAENV